MARPLRISLIRGWYHLTGWEKISFSPPELSNLESSSKTGDSSKGNYQSPRFGFAHFELYEGSSKKIRRQLGSLKLQRGSLASDNIVFLV